MVEVPLVKKIFHSLHRGIFVPLVLMALLLSACGSSGGASPDGGERRAGAAVEDEEDAESQEEPSLAHPGILTGSCAQSENIFTLFSDDDASVITSAVFKGYGVRPGESEILSHGRAAQPIGDIDLPSCGSAARSLIAEHGLLLVTFEEEVNGNTVSSFGVLSEERTLTALNPAQEVSDFETPFDHVFPSYDAVEKRIVFVERVRHEGGTVQALDLESGEITEIGKCEANHCKRLTVPQGSGLPVLADGYSGRLLVSTEGSYVLFSGIFFGASALKRIDFSDLPEESPVKLDQRSVSTSTTYEIYVENGAMVSHIIDPDTLLFADNELSVLELTEEAIEDHVAANADQPSHRRKVLPVTRTLIPEGPRKNSQFALSPDGTEVLFHSKPENGDAGWYRVPVDGSEAPEKFAPSPEAAGPIVTWQ